MDETLLWLLSQVDGPDFLTDSLFTSLELAQAQAAQYERDDGASEELEWDETYGARQWVHVACSTTGSFDWDIRPVRLVR